MIYIPEISDGKALVAVKSKRKNKCKGCIFLDAIHEMATQNCYSMACEPKDREDGKFVIFKIIDLPPDGLTRTFDLMQFSRKELGEEL